MLRYIIFRFLFNPWFKNPDGIKAFAQLCMNWLLRSALSLAAVLKTKNRRLSEKNNEFTALRDEKIKFPVIDADDFATISKEIRNYKLLEWIVILAESFFNYFAAKAIFNFPGWLGIAAQIIFALGVTWVSIPLFRNLFTEIIHEEPYKSSEIVPRNLKKLVLLLAIALIYELGMYNLCQLRGEQIEGAAPGFITWLMIILGMLLPVIAGYFSYEKRRLYSPYINTITIDRIKREIASNEMKIQTNIQRMEGHFKSTCQRNWSLLQEFQLYKGNYNHKRDIPDENLSGHFCETQQAFWKEAITRYNQESIPDQDKSNVRSLLKFSSPNSGNSFLTAN